MTDRQLHDRFTGISLTVCISDDVTRRLGADGGDLSRRALEALASGEYQAGCLTKPELRGLLGFETRAKLDGSAF